MSTQNSCVKCGHTDVIPGARVICNVQTPDQDIQLRVDADPNALVFKNACRSVMSARICAKCGFTEFYAEDPGSLYAAYRQAQG